MTYLRIGFFLLFFGTTVIINGQPLKEIPLRFKLEAADSAYYKNDYYNALEWYNEVYREDRQNFYLNRIAELYFKVRDYKRAERWLQRLIDRDKEMEYPDARLYYGQVLKMNGKYDEAAIQFQDIMRGNFSQEAKRVADVELKGITLAESLIRPANIAVVNTGTRINTRNSEATPIPIAGGDLYFISFGENQLIVPSNEEINAQAKIFNAKMNNNGEFTRRATAIEDFKLGQNGHIGNVFVEPDGRSLYFTYFLLNGNKLEKSEIYYSTASGRGWSTPKKVEGLPELGIVKNPSTGTLLGQKVLFFAYNGTGQGGYDIFYAPLLSDTQVGNVVPVGNGINTPGDEISPIFSSNTLYFSTNGHPSIGGFDIYSALWTGETWTRIENMGKGINSTLDETFYFPSGEQINGYLVSNREGTRSVLSSTCCDDIFQLEDKTIIIRLLATVLEGEEPLNGASIAVFPVEQNEWGSPDIQYNENGNEFTFSIDADKAYQVVVSREGYNSDTVAFNTVGVVESKDFRGTFRLKKLPQEEEEVITLNEPIRLNNIYYDYDDDKILIEAEEDLDYLYNLLTEYPNMVIELS
ncbi:MAG TPA: tetratricopeptide repeat protein, partial [Membranihabitans sp.]|nr:tetratricopeptide repeat protein [Membranihabitans sp.]